MVKICIFVKKTKIRRALKQIKIENNFLYASVCVCVYVYGELKKKKNCFFYI
jgi:hypothetical protein